MNDWRQQLTALLEEGSWTRKPALRRSRLAEAMYATDLPLFSSEEEVNGFLFRLKEAGWKGWIQDGWLQMVPMGLTFPKCVYEGSFGREATACGSLLARHPRGTVEMETAFRLVKAGEEGPDAFERTCGQLHQEWAIRLRNHEPLPDIPVSWFGGD